MTSQLARLPRWLPVGCALAVLACGSSPFSRTPAEAPAPAIRPGATLAEEPFSGDRAWAHLVALSELGPRPHGSTANQEAAEYIRSRLEELGLDVKDLPISMGKKKKGDQKDSADAEAPAGEDGGAARISATHIVATIPGPSPDTIALMAHFDTAATTTGANDGASGPAVLLELARQLMERPLDYTVQFVFLDNEMAFPEVEKEDAPAAETDTEDADAEAAPDAEAAAPPPPPDPLLHGSNLLAGYLEHAGVMDEIRLAVFYRQVGDSDLTVARDLHSNRIHRDTFFDTAADLGLGAAFPTDRGFTETRSSHRPFVSHGLRRVVAISDPWYGGDEPPGEFWGEMDRPEHCSPESLHTVGVVSLGALRRISQQLAKIDRASGRQERIQAEAMEAAPALTGEAVEEAPLEPAAPSPVGAAETDEAAPGAAAADEPAAAAEKAPEEAPEAPETPAESS